MGHFFAILAGLLAVMVGLVVIKRLCRWIDVPLVILAVAAGIFALKYTESADLSLTYILVAMAFSFGFMAAYVAGVFALRTLFYKQGGEDSISLTRLLFAYTMIFVFGLLIVTGVFWIVESFDWALSAFVAAAAIWDFYNEDDEFFWDK